MLVTLLDDAVSNIFFPTCSYLPQGEAAAVVYAVRTTKGSGTYGVDNVRVAPDSIVLELTRFTPLCEVP